MNTSAHNLLCPDKIYRLKWLIVFSRIKSTYRFRKNVSIFQLIKNTKMNYSEHVSIWIFLFKKYLKLYSNSFRIKDCLIFINNVFRAGRGRIARRDREAWLQIRRRNGAHRRIWLLGHKLLCYRHYRRQPGPVCSNAAATFVLSS